MVKCAIGCLCGRHLPWSLERREAARRSCSIDCTCKRHTNAPLWAPDDPRRTQLIARNKSTQQRAAVSAATLGRPKHSPESRELIRQAHLGMHPSPETLRKLSVIRKGHPVSEATRAKQKSSNQKTWASPEMKLAQSLRMGAIAEQGGNRPEHIPWSYTLPHRQLVAFLEGAGFELRTEEQFGRFSVDVYLPEEHLAFEADGIYWHDLNDRERPGYYNRRDIYLMEKFGLPVVRITDVELAAIAA